MVWLLFDFCEKLYSVIIHCIACNGGTGKCVENWGSHSPFCLPLFICAVGPLIGKYCGTKTPSELRSSTGILSLTFHTDMAVAKDGFSARYYLVHQEPLESKSATRELLSCPPVRAVRCPGYESLPLPQMERGTLQNLLWCPRSGKAPTCQAEIKETRTNADLGAHSFYSNVCVKNE